MPRSEMPVFCVGLSHRTAPVGLLERLSRSVNEQPFLLDLLAGAQAPRRREVVLLSTCNRIELYVATSEESGELAGDESTAMEPRLDVLEALSKHASLDRAELEPHLFHMKGREAGRHLYRVAAGLDSLILGEAQVLGQTASAYAASQQRGLAGPVLSALFQGAIRAGRRVRRETEIGASAANMSSAAVRLAEERAGDLAVCRVVVVGTGEMGRLALRSLRERGAGTIDLVNRHFERAAAAARRWGAKAHLFESLPCLIENADVVVSSTAALRPIISERMIRDAMRERSGRPLVLVDLAVPRDVDPAASTIPGVQLFDLDALKGAGGNSKADFQAAVNRAASIIEEELNALDLRMAEIALNPVLASLWRRADSIREEVLARTRRRLPTVDEAAWGHVESLAQALVNKLLHAPAVRLRAAAGNGHAESFAEALRALFELSDEASLRDRRP